MGAAGMTVLLAAVGTQGCLTGGAVRMLTRCRLERLEVQARSLDAPAAEIAWEGRCPGNQVDDGPRIGPPRSGVLRVPMPQASCPRAEVWAIGRVTTDRWASALGPPVRESTTACTVVIRSDGRQIVAVAPGSDGERTLAASDVRQLTTNPLWWSAVPDSLAVDGIVGGAGAVFWLLGSVRHGL
jgi:hypothetical protein